MKKILSITMVLVLCVAFVLPVTISAAPNASAKFAGPEAVWAGDTITLSFMLKGTGLLGMEGLLTYDSTQVTLSNIRQKIEMPWVLETNGNKVVMYDNQQTAPVNTETEMFVAVFKVNSNLAAGTRINIALNNCIASDGTDANLGAITYSVIVSEPKSADNTLKSLAVSNALLTTEFNPNTVAYTTTVPFSIAKLELKAEATHNKAKVTINNPDLVVGTNFVTITVAAENGTKKTYTIKVTRQQDPNYVPNSENALTDLWVEGFLISPVFSETKTEYVVWLPYETEQIVAGGTAKDEKATVRVEGGDVLLAGQDNPVKVICVAENGSEKVYTIVAKRAAAHDGSVDTPADPETPDDPGTSEPPDTPDEPQQPETPSDSGGKQGGIDFWWLIVVFVLGVALGVGGVILYLTKVINKK